VSSKSAVRKLYGNFVDRELAARPALTSFALISRTGEVAAIRQHLDRTSLSYRLPRRRCGVPINLKKKAARTPSNASEPNTKPTIGSTIASGMSAGRLTDL
jgi:hypothetical protein